MFKRSVLLASMSALLLLLSSYSLVANAAEQTASEALKAKLSQLQSFSADFSQRVVDINGEVLQEAAGTIALQQPNKMHWRVIAPDETLLIGDGQTLWHVDPFVEQVVAMDQNSAVQNNPLILLTNPNGESWKDFTVTKQDNNFTVSANAEGAVIERLSLHFKQDTLVGIEMLDSQQQISTLLFSNIKQNIALAPGLFTFELPEGFDVDDQRGQ